MVAHLTMRTYGVNQEFLFVERIWLHQKSRQIRFFFSRKIPFLHHACATCSEHPSNIKTMGFIYILYGPGLCSRTVTPASCQFVWRRADLSSTQTQSSIRYQCISIAGTFHVLESSTCWFILIYLGF